MSYKDLERKRVAAEQQAQASARQAAQQQEAARRALELQWEQDRKLRANELKDMVERSPVRNEMVKMQSQLLGGIHSEIITDTERGMLTLAWGKFRRVGKGFDYTIFGREQNFRYIVAKFDSDQQTIHIGGKGIDPQSGNSVLTQAQWNDQVQLEIALHSAYANPLQVVDRVPSRQRSRSSGSSGGCVGCAGVY